MLELNLQKTRDAALIFYNKDASWFIHEIPSMSANKR